jgi:hypothetical protein
MVCVKIYILDAYIAACMHSVSLHPVLLHLGGLKPAVGIDMHGVAAPVVLVTSWSALHHQHYIMSVKGQPPI